MGMELRLHQQRTNPLVWSGQGSFPSAKLDLYRQRGSQSGAKSYFLHLLEIQIS